MHLAKASTTILVFLILVSCRIEISVPSGGSVTSNSGTYHCDPGDNCAIEVVDEYFNETFVAVPASGYTFNGWKKKEHGLCWNSTGPCEISSEYAQTQPVWMSLIESDEVFYLEPSFAIAHRVPSDFGSIQEAINASGRGDVVLVSPGIYYETIDFQGKKITVASEQGPELTVIDGSDLGPVVTFQSGETRSSVLKGLTIRNGLTGPNEKGAGILILDASPTVTENIVTENQAYSHGGAIGIGRGSPLILKNIIRNNKGGILVSQNVESSAEIRENQILNNTHTGIFLHLYGNGIVKIINNVIRENSGSHEGGGIGIISDADVLIQQNLIINNTASRGAGIYWSAASSSSGPTILNNTIAHNYSSAGYSGIYANGFDSRGVVKNNIIFTDDGGPAVYCSDDYGHTTETPSFKSNDIFSLNGVPYAGLCDNQTGINDNISTDPLFKNPETGNYLLRHDSPAVDAGRGDRRSEQRDLARRFRTVDGDGNCSKLIDLGAYEYQKSAIDC